MIIMIKVSKEVGLCEYIYTHTHIYKLSFNLSHMLEPRLVAHPTHLGASPGSAVGSGRALERDEGGSVSPRPVLSPPNVGSTSRQEKVAPAAQCVSSIAPQNGVNHLPTPWPTPSHSTQAVRASGSCSVPEQGQGSLGSFACGFGAVYPLLILVSSKLQCICSHIYIP